MRCIPISCMAGARRLGREACRLRLARRRALRRLRSQTRSRCRRPAVIPEAPPSLIIEVVLRNGRLVRFPERIGARRAARLADALDGSER
jgi:hypothetical protein